MKIWVLSTCIPDENEPCLPEVFASETKAALAFAEAMRMEWENNAPYNDDGERLPFPDDPQEAHDRMAENVNWGQYELSCHEVEL